MFSRSQTQLPVDRPRLGVLIVEDSADARANMRDLLELDGYDIYEAASFAEAISRDDWETISVILLDRKLPDGDANDMLPEFRRLAPHASIVMVTGVPDVEGAVQALHEGAYDYLLKPINPDALRASLRRISRLSDTQRSLDAEAAARRRAESQNRLLAEAISSMGDCVIITDAILLPPGPRILFVNDAVRRVTGYEPRDLIGKSPRILQGAHTDRRQMERLKRDLSAGRSFRCQLVNYRKDGSPYDAELFITPIFDSNGCCTNFVSSHRDTTELKTAERALRESEERMRAILTTANDAIITTDYKGIITEANPATETMFGYATDELIGQNVRMLMPDPYHSNHENHLARYQETREARIIGIGREAVGRRKDGSTFPLSLAVSKIDHPPLYTGIVRDISALKELQKQVLEIAAEEDRRIGHELHDSVQQQLTGLGLMAQSVAEMLLSGDEWGEPCKPQVAKISKLADRVAKGISEATREVHQLSRGLVPVEIDAGGLRSALAELADSIREQYRVDCTFRCGGDVDFPDNFEATHLFRIVQEAVNNAIKHGHANRIDVSMTGKEEAILLEVIDNGRGIPDKQSAGIGLGLKIMGYRAGLIGATVQVVPAEEKGTLVRCTIPRRSM